MPPLALYHEGNGAIERIQPTILDTQAIGDMLTPTKVRGRHLQNLCGIW